MDNGIRPSTIMMIGGGLLLFIASLLDWSDLFGTSVSRTDQFGLQWLFTLSIGGGITVLVVLSTFTTVHLPDDLLGLNMNQIYLMLSFAAFLILFGLQFARSTEPGVYLGWIAAAVMTAGAFMEEQSSASGAPPTQF